MEKDKLRITEVKIFRINVFKNKTELLRGPSHVKNEQNQEKTTNNKGKHFREITTMSNSAVVQESRNKIKLEFKGTKQTNENDGRNVDCTPKVKLLRRNNATEIRGPKPSIAENKSEHQVQLFKTGPTRNVQDLETQKSSSFDAKFQVNKAVAPQIKRSEIDVTVVKSILPRPTSMDKTVLPTSGNDPKFPIKKEVQEVENTQQTEGQHYLQTRSKPEMMGNKVLAPSNRKVPVRKDDQERNSNASKVQTKQTELVYQPKQILRKQVQKPEEAIKPPSGITPEVKKQRRYDEPEYLDKMMEFIAFKFRNIGENLPKAVYECKVCEQSFDNAEEAKTKHGLIPNCDGDTLAVTAYYGCRICFLRMDTVYEVLRHESQVHYCENCKKMYASEYSKNNHMVACKISSKFYR